MANATIATTRCGIGSFAQVFEAVTGYRPLSWQSRLYEQQYANALRPVIDLPTGLGKTSVIGIWLIARAKQVADVGGSLGHAMAFGDKKGRNG